MLLNLMLLGLGASMRNMLNSMVGDGNSDSTVMTMWHNIYEVVASHASHPPSDRDTLTFTKRSPLTQSKLVQPMHQLLSTLPCIVS